MIIHVVAPGESLFSIAREYDSAVDDLAYANQLRYPDRLVTGQALVIPGADEPPQKSIHANGYALPSISSQTLDYSLPYLTWLSVFSYAATAGGELRGVDDRRMIEAAYGHGASPMLTVTNIRPSGGFSPDIAHSILTNSIARTNLIDNILSVLDEKDYMAVNMDFEYIPPDDRQAYNNFLSELKARLDPIGYLLTTAVAPKISADQPGQLYEAHDYAAQGEIVDFVVIMTYEWGYTYGPPMAVAPLDQVQRVLDYAVSDIPSSKILMGIPNYGYDWTLPYQQGRAARSLSNTAAVSLASTQNARIMFDETAQSPYFNYREEGVDHVVWFEDARSLQAKLRQVESYDLGGVSYWNLNSLFRTIWYVQSSMYTAVKLF